LVPLAGALPLSFPLPMPSFFSISSLGPTKRSLPQLGDLAIVPRCCLRCLKEMDYKTDCENDAEEL
jgi:hypothetical protein